MPKPAFRNSSIVIPASTRWPIRSANAASSRWVLRRLAMAPRMNLVWSLNASAGCRYAARNAVTKSRIGRLSNSRRIASAWTWRGIGRQLIAAESARARSSIESVVRFLAIVLARRRGDRCETPGECRSRLHRRRSHRENQLPTKALHSGRAVLAPRQALALRPSRRQLSLHVDWPLRPIHVSLHVDWPLRPIHVDVSMAPSLCLTCREV